MALRDKNPPTVHPLTLSETKQFLRVEHNHEDELIAGLIGVACEQVEQSIGRTLVVRDLIYTGKLPSRSCFTLPRPPLVNVASIHIIDQDGSKTLINFSEFTVSIYTDPSEVRLSKARGWYDFSANPNAIEIEFSAGYGETANDVPLPIRQALLLIVSNLYEHRDDADRASIPMMADALLMPYRWVRL